MSPAELFIDDSGKLSSSRILIWLIVIVYLALVGYLTIKVGSLVDFPGGALALVGALYGINKFSPTTPFTPNKVPAGGEKAG